MKNFYLTVFFLTCSYPAFAQTSTKLNSWHLGTGLSYINEPQLKTGAGFNTGVAVQLASKLNGIINVEYVFASSIKQDDRYLNKYNLNKSLAYVRIDAGLEKTILTVKNLDFGISTAIALRKRNEAFASVFYKQFPLEQLPRLVSETTYSSKWQLGNNTTVKVRLNFKRLFIGVNSTYQLFAKNSFLSSGIFTGLKF